MPIILVCGERNSGFGRARDVLRGAGLADAKPSKREDYSPEDLSLGICAAYDVDPADPSAIAQIEPGKVWQALSIDLMLSNLSAGDWGWADPNLVYLLDHWRDFDPQVKFVLVYSSPEEAVAELISTGDTSPERIRAGLAAWEAYNGELLRFFYANRDRCLLVNSATVAENAGLFAELTRDHLKARKLGEVVGSPLAPLDRSPIRDLVSSSLVADAVEARLLFQELESAADMPGAREAGGDGDPSHNIAAKWEDTPRPPAREFVLKVWDEFRDLRGRIDASEAAARADRKEMLESRQEKQLLLLHLAQLQEELEATFLGLQARDDELAAKSAESEARAAEIAALTEDRDHHVWLAGERAGEIAALTEDRNHQAWLAEERAAEIAALMERLGRLEHDNAELNVRLSSGGGQSSELTRRVKDLSTENGLLVLQLQQLQEELETYYLKYQEATNQREAASAPAPAAAVSTPAPAAGEAVLDLRGLVDGNNWHNAEHDGRWSGPEPTSHLHLPRMAKGRYRLELDVVDAMSPTIMRGLEVRIGGRPVKLKGPRGFAGSWLPFLGRKKKKLKYPLVLTGDVSLAADGDVDVEFKVPRTVTPMVHGSADSRYLGFRLRQVKLSRA